MITQSSVVNAGTTKCPLYGKCIIENSTSSAKNGF